MGTAIDIFVKAFKTLWKFSGPISILVIVFLIEIGVVENWRQHQMDSVLQKADLHIVSAEPVAGEPGLQYKITVRNEGSNDCRPLPSIIINYDDDHSYLEPVDLYTELIDENEYFHISTGIPAKTEVTLYYKVDEYSEEEIKNAQELSLQMPAYESISTAEYPLSVR